MGKLHLFDMDGTLLHGSAAAIEISRQLGLDREIAELERGFAAGELTPRSSLSWHATYGQPS